MPIQDPPGIDQLVDGLIAREGGFVDHPADRGGATNWGITEAVARAHRFGSLLIVLLTPAHERVSHSNLAT